jgi:transposase InsO family protein
LFYKWEDPLEPRKLLLVPEALKDEVLRLNHDIRDAGHFGQQNTYSRIKDSFYWYRMRNSVFLYVRTCAKCNTNKKQSRKKRANLGEYHAGAPMDRVHLDILGPFSKSARGNTVILMVIDQFSKWLECYPLPDQSAELVAKTVVDEFFSRFGCPLEIHTDQGKNFMSNLFSCLCTLLQISKTRTTSYHPQSNGQVERMNRSILQMLRCLRDKNIRNWDVYLPQLCGALRSTRNRSTGYTANKLMLGREVNKPSNLVYGVPTGEHESEGVDGYVKDLEDVLRRTHDVARENLQESVTLNKRDYDLRARYTRYGAGDMVYLLNNQTTPGISRKLQPIYKGPFLVVKVISDVLYRLKDRRREFVVHHDRLILCQDRFIPLWLRRLRHQFMNLDETIAYDEQEQDVGVNEYLDSEQPFSLASLFETPNELPNTKPDDSLPVSQLPEASASSISHAVSNNPSSADDFSSASPIPPTNSSIMPLPETSIPDQIMDPTNSSPPSDSGIGSSAQNITRRGREIKVPKKFEDYVLGDLDE